MKIDAVLRSGADKRTMLRFGSAAIAIMILPGITGCMSGISDISSFGFDRSATAQNDKPVEIESAPELALAEGAETPEASQQAEISVSEETAEEVANAEPADAANDRALIPLSSGRETIAAYAGGTVEQAGAAPAQSGGRSLFESLFAREEARTPVPNAERGKERRVVVNRSESGGNDALPGVDPSSLFEIGQRASADEDELEDASYQVASLGGFARLAPNGLAVQREDVRTDCFSRELVGMLRSIERRFGQRVVVTSGYRSPAHNRRVNGATRSQHMACKAADILVPNVDSRQVAAFVRELPGRGGVGTYCHTKSIHVDTGPNRDWNWRCRRR